MRIFDYAKVASRWSGRGGVGVPLSAGVGRSGGRMAQISLPLSIAVILANWIWHLLHFAEFGMPDSVGDLAVQSCLKTAVVVGITWPLLYANGERFADLGFGLRALHLALPRGILVAVGLWLLVSVRVHVHVGTLVAAFGGAETTPSVTALFRNPREAPLWLFVAIVGGGFSPKFPLRKGVSSRLAWRIRRSRGLRTAYIL